MYATEKKDWIKEEEEFYLGPKEPQEPSPKVIGWLNALLCIAGVFVVLTLVGAPLGHHHHREGASRSERLERQQRMEELRQAAEEAKRE